MRFVWNALGPHRGGAILLLAIIFMVSITQSIGLWMIMPVLELAVNPVTESKSLAYLATLLSLFDKANYLWVVGSMLIGAMLVKTIFAILQDYYVMKYSTDLRRFWEAGVLDRYLHGRYDIIASQKHGALLNNILQEPLLAAKLIREGAEALSRVIISLFVLSVVLIVDWQVTAGLLVLLIFFFSVTWSAIGKYSQNVGKKKLRLNQKLNALASEFLHGIRQIKIFSAETKAISQFEAALNELFVLIIKFTFLSKFPKIVAEVLLYSGVVFFVLYNRYISGASISSLLPVLGLFLVAFQTLFNNLSVLVSKRMSVLSCVPSLRLVNGIMNDRSVTEIDQGDKAPEKLSGDIEFDNVSFGYDKKCVIEKLSLRIRKNQVTALVGLSGSGKSTICDLIARFYEPDSGSISIGGNSIHKYSVKEWRRKIAYVAQDTFLFDGTIRENVLVGKPEASAQELEEALMAAQAHQFVLDMPQGENTMLGNSGAQLSGGQRQRIALARAVIRSAPVLILDESTSSLDTRLERKVFEYLESCKEGRTIIIISHNMATLKNADNIFVLDSGKIVEQGNFSELLNGGGGFERLARAAEKAVNVDLVAQ